jgi:predicted transcriptional regulator
VAEVISASPSAIWRDYGQQCGVTKAEFDAYYEGASTAYIIVFSSIKKLPSTFALGEIRRHSESFQPPQFFKRLLIGCPELNLFTSRISSKLAA